MNHKRQYPRSIIISLLFAKKAYRHLCGEMDKDQGEGNGDGDCEPGHGDIQCMAGAGYHSGNVPAGESTPVQIANNRGQERKKG